MHLLKIFYFYPICLAALGGLLHFFGTFGIEKKYPLWFHILKCTIDILVVGGLFKKVFWGYWLAVGLMLFESISQSYYAYNDFQDHSSDWQLHAAAAFFYFLGLFTLRFDKRIFLR